MNQAQSGTGIPPSFRLYKVSGIAIASVFGSILAGGLLMTLNYRMLGKRELARRALLLTVAATVLVFVIAFQIPPDWHVPNTAFTAPQIVLMVYLARWAQGGEIAAHVRGGGTMASNWKALGISLLVLIALLLVLFLVIYALDAIPGGGNAARLPA